ncbi:MAG: hypothetical protein IKN79_07170 [Eubacterium sp.]|nr:hypothetical protein [Eubacterium sp.]
MEKEKQPESEIALQEQPDGPPAKKKRHGLCGNDKGVAVVEVILILVVLIALVIIFRDQITALVNTIWTSINGDAQTLL